MLSFLHDRPPQVTTPTGQLEYADAELRRARGLPLHKDSDVAADLSAATAPTGKSKHLLVPIEDMVARFWGQNEHGQAMMQVRDLGAGLVIFFPLSCHSHRGSNPHRAMMRVCDLLVRSF